MEKFIYIKKSQNGKFLDFEEKFNEELFDNIGTTWEDYEAGKWVLLNKEQVEFHKKYPHASEKEVWDMKIIVPVPSEESTTPDIIPDDEVVIPDVEEDTVKERKLKEIDKYNDVYSFTLKGKSMWLDSQQRREILEQVSAYRSMKLKEMTKWIDNTEYTFTLKQWTKIVQHVAVYASKVENVKNMYKKNVNELIDDNDIDAYDYTKGYPEKLNFEEL